MHLRTHNLASFVALGLLIGSCASPEQVPPTAEPTSIPTFTPSSSPFPTPSPSRTATATVSPTPSPPSPTPGPTTPPGIISGVVLLHSTSDKPFPTTIELRPRGDVVPVKSTRASSSGQFSFSHTPAGDYEVWALITTKTTVPSGCRDILVEEGSFRIGVHFASNLALTSENPSLGYAMRVASRLDPPEFKAPRFYAVTNLTLATQSGIALPIHLYCQ